jgi:hypothetical protein
MYETIIRDHPNDGGSKHLKHRSDPRDYAALYPKKLSSLYSPPWEPEMSPWFCMHNAENLVNVRLEDLSTLRLVTDVKQDFIIDM